MEMVTLFLLKILLLPVLQAAYNDANNKLEATNRKYPPFGRTMREEFQFDPGFTSLNHGAYGTYPKDVRMALHAFQARSEANTELWIRRDARKELTTVRVQLADLVNAEAEDIVMIPNTTSGMNAIFRSLIFHMGGRILHLNTIYMGMRSLFNFVSDYSNGKVTTIQFNVTYPISNSKLVAAFEKFLDEEQNTQNPIRIALVDHISSVPGVIMPLEHIIPILRQRNILILIDGAHALGQIPINIKALQPDFYITDCHKWLYAARGCSMMYVDKKHQETIHPATISYNYARPSRFQDEFFWTGTRDYSSYLSVRAALEFRRQVGGEAAIQAYNHDLALEGARYLAVQFGTEILEEEEQIANMVDVRLPIANPENKLLTTDFWTDTLLYGYSVYAFPHYYNHKWYIRLCAQIYNDMEDFKMAAKAFSAICNNINSNFTLPSNNI